MDTNQKFSSPIEAFYLLLRIGFFIKNRRTQKKGKRDRDAKCYAAFSMVLHRFSIKNSLVLVSKHDLGATVTFTTSLLLLDLLWVALTTDEEKKSLEYQNTLVKAILKFKQVSRLKFKGKLNIFKKLYPLFGYLYLYN